jgi:hypothetical protein
MPKRGPTGPGSEKHSNSQRYRRDEMRSKDSRDEGPVGDMSAWLATATRTSERVLRCVRAMRVVGKACAVERIAGPAPRGLLSPVFSAHRTFAKSLGTRAQNPTLSQHCGTSYRRRNQFKIFVTRSHITHAPQKCQLRCEVRDNRNLPDLVSKLCQLRDAAICVPCLACSQVMAYRRGRHISESQLSRPLDPYT